MTRGHRAATDTTVGVWYARAMAKEREAMIQGVPARVRRERFAGHFVESRNPELAYRLAFVVDQSMTADWIAREAKRLLADPDVMLEVQQLRDTAAAATLTSVRDLLQDWHDIATADPNEIVSVIAESCRFCHGIDHAYQWKNELEYAAACESAIKMKLQPPGCEGGFGYSPVLDPAFDCPGCYGRGEQRVMLHDTRKLSRAARKLYKGAKETRFGIEVLMHDQQAARESLGRVLGAFKDGIPMTPTRDVPVIPKDASPEKAKETYLRVVASNGQRVA